MAPTFHGDVHGVLGEYTPCVWVTLGTRIRGVYLGPRADGKHEAVYQHPEHGATITVLDTSPAVDLDHPKGRAALAWWISAQDWEIHLTSIQRVDLLDLIGFAQRGWRMPVERIVHMHDYALKLTGRA